jgi:hypothetical protein
LATQVASAGSNYSKINGENKKISDIKVEAKTIQVAINRNVNAGTEEPFTTSLDTFKNPPVVTATAVNEGGTVSGKDIYVVLTNVTTSSVSGVVRFGSSGILSVNVNIVAVGLPN